MTTEGYYSPRGSAKIGPYMLEIRDDLYHVTGPSIDGVLMTTTATAASTAVGRVNGRKGKLQPSLIWPGLPTTTRGKSRKGRAIKADHVLALVMTEHADMVRTTVRAHVLSGDDLPGCDEALQEIERTISDARKALLSLSETDEEISMQTDMIASLRAACEAAKLPSVAITATLSAPVAELESMIEARACLIADMADETPAA